MFQGDDNMRLRINFKSVCDNERLTVVILPRRGMDAYQRNMLVHHPPSFRLSLFDGLVAFKFIFFALPPFPTSPVSREDYPVQRVTESTQPNLWH